MNALFSAYFVLLLIPPLITSTLAVYAWRHRAVQGAKAFTALIFVITWWGVGQVVLYLVGDHITPATWAMKFLLLVINFLGPVLLVFVLQYTQRERWLTRTLIWVLFLPEFIFTIILFTNELHHLYWTRIYVDRTLPNALVVFEFGTINWASLIYSYLLIGISMALIVHWALSNSAKLYRQQAWALLISVVAPLAASVSYILGFIKIDPTHFAFSISGLALGWSLFRFQFLNLMSIAREVVIEGMSDSILVLDAQERITDMNPAAERLFGFSVSQAVGRAVGDVLAQWPHLVERYRDTRNALEEITVGEDDLQDWYEMRISQLHDRRGQFVGRVVVLRNITAQKLAEKVLAIARDQALESSRAKSHLLAKVSHELRTPLGGIVGFAELLYDDTFGSLGERQKHATAQIIESAHYLTDMVNELLDEAKVESNTIQLRLSRFLFSDMFEKVNANMEVLANKKGLSIITYIALDLPETFIGDEQRLRQVLTNLIGNAIKFTDQGEVRLNFFKPDPEHWVMQVGDTGIGIPEDARAYIFDPFRQVDASLASDHGGTGLGLSIARQLVELMGGQITLESEVGQGSTFTVLLPIIENQEKIS
ncbi:MAG: PAS domain-containing protein [Anaerolineales bacterium]|nr:PAS domain-containing protein [Anaerolineales bacterium]